MFIISWFYWFIFKHVFSRFGYTFSFGIYRDNWVILFMCLWRCRYMLMLLFRNFIFVCVFTSAVLSNYWEFSLFVFRSCPYLGNKYDSILFHLHTIKITLSILSYLIKLKLPTHFSKPSKGSVDNIRTASQKLLKSTFLFLDASSHYLNTD